MMGWPLALMAALLPVAAQAGTLTALRTLPAGTVIEARDVARDPSARSRPGDQADVAAVVGKATRITVYAGRPILAANIVTPTLVDRNQTVVIGYASGGLSIQTEGRALGKGGSGDIIRVLNNASRATLSARINPDGTLSVLSR